MSKLLSGQVALVTDGVADVGRATALAFATAGVKVVVADLGSVGGEDTIEAIRQTGGEALFIHCDITRDAEVKVLVEGCTTAYDRPNYAFNNAGIKIEQDKLASGNEAEFDAVAAVNIKGVWLCMRHQIPLMLVQGDGAIVNTTSVAGLGTAPKMSIYAASEHAVIGLTESTAIEYTKKGIRVNAMCSATIDTDMFRRAYEAGPRKAEFAAAIHPLGQVRRIEGIAAVVLCPCSNNAGFTTGIVLPADGGMAAIWAGDDITGMPRRRTFASYYRSARGLMRQATAGGLTWVEDPGPEPVSITSKQ